MGTTKDNEQEVATGDDAGPGTGAGEAEDGGASTPNASPAGEETEAAEAVAKAGPGQAPDTGGAVPAGDAATGDIPLTGNGHGSVEGAQPGQEGAGAEAADALSDAELLRGLAAEIAKLRDEALRAKAEADNVSKRAQTQVQQARKYAVTGFAAGLLDVRDALDATLANRESDKGALIEGVELAVRVFDKVFERENIRVIDPKEGEPFNPELHEAMTHMETDRMGPGMVAAVMVKGYAISERVLRAAQVAVSKGPAKGNGPTTAEDTGEDDGGANAAGTTLED